VVSAPSADTLLIKAIFSSDQENVETRDLDSFVQMMFCADWRIHEALAAQPTSSYVRMNTISLSSFNRQRDKKVVAFVEPTKKYDILNFYTCISISNSLGQSKCKYKVNKKIGKDSKDIVQYRRREQSRAPSRAGEPCSVPVPVLVLQELVLLFLQVLVLR
jgi:hypothetical protein